MEYLMTYGWAILIIAVVLSVLFGFGIFNGGSLLGNTCVASPGFVCSTPVLGTNGNIAFTFGQSTGTAVYNVGLGCAATTNSSGLLPNPAASLIYLSATGAATSMPANAPGSGPLSLQSGQTVAVTGLQCFTASGVAFVTAGTNSIGSPFSGTLWVNYTLSAGASGGANPIITTKFATFTAKVA
jgi:hypothetical protein